MQHDTASPDFASLDGSLTISSKQDVYSFTSSTVATIHNVQRDNSVSSGESSHDLFLPDLEPPSWNDSQTVPFRAETGYHHATWARTFRSRPELYIRPRSVEEIQKIVILARKCRRRLVVVGAGHSPSDLTCTSAWMVHLGDFAQVLSVRKTDDKKKTGGFAVLQAGITLHEINQKMMAHGLTMPNLGSIDIQSIAGAIATATHGSSTRHGLLSDSIRSLRIVLADGRAVACSVQHRPDLFRAALVSLGCLGIITEVEFGLVPSTNIEWSQDVFSLEAVLSRWEKDLWTQAEYVRCWWLPYGRRMISWTANKTEKPPRSPKESFYGGSFGYHLYHTLLWIAHYIPSILPSVEYAIFSLQYRSTPGHVTSAVEVQREGLLMDCLYSQFVNEWALSLDKGPEAIRRLSAWMHGDESASRIPFSSKGIYVHAPIEVRVTDGSDVSPRGYLDPTQGGPTLYLNATLYRPYGLDPPCVARYYEAFEWLMKDLGGRPHWAKNWSYVSHSELKGMYGQNMVDFLRVREEVDPDGLFVSAWHRRNLLGKGAPLKFEEREISRRPAIKAQTPMKGGMDWFGAQARGSGQGLSGETDFKSVGSEESFELVDEERECLQGLLYQVGS